jgi:ABC-2 type transport system ATP-binding protein
MPATGRENLMLAGRLYGMTRRDVEHKAEELSRLLDIDEILDRIVRTYSGGQKRRLEIALGIIHEPEILFMDEPSTGLDPQNRANLWTHIRKLKEKGMTIFLTTHYLDEADALADRLSIMDYGRIVAEGSPQELKRQISGDAIILKLKSDADAQAAYETIHKQAFVSESKIDERTIHLYAVDGTKALPVLFDILKEKSIEPETVSISAPSLEDVFLKKTGRRLRDTGKENVL